MTDMSQQTNLTSNAAGASRDCLRTDRSQREDIAIASDDDGERDWDARDGELSVSTSSEAESLLDADEATQELGDESDNECSEASADASDDARWPREYTIHDTSHERVISRRQLLYLVVPKTQVVCFARASRRR